MSNEKVKKTKYIHVCQSTSIPCHHHHHQHADCRYDNCIRTITTALLNKYCAWRLVALVGDYCDRPRLAFIHKQLELYGRQTLR